LRAKDGKKREAHSVGNKEGLGTNLDPSGREERHYNANERSVDVGRLLDSKHREPPEEEVAECSASKCRGKGDYRSAKEIHLAAPCLKGGRNCADGDSGHFEPKKHSRRDSLYRPNHCCPESRLI